MPLASARGTCHLAHSKFCFHKYPLEVPSTHQLNWWFLLGTSSLQRGYSILSVLAFLLVLCVLRGGRRFLIGFRFKVQIFKESTELLNYKPKTLNFELLNLEQLNLHNL
ncbi:hypothetical protein EJN86_06520 [Riemerella anatipestifer]|nr:hypothetical protein [Riemerella anatipestifer]NAV16479.1 hypothetical protein [Riemerella anatipestifer]